MTCGKHEYYLEIRVHVHITSKNGDALKLQAEICHGRHFPPDMTPVMTYLIGQILRKSGSSNFQGGRKRMVGKLYKIVTFDR